jgi:hypothetical protein
MFFGEMFYSFNWKAFLIGLVKLAYLPESRDAGWAFSSSDFRERMSGAWGIKHPGLGWA